MKKYLLILFAIAITSSHFSAKAQISPELLDKTWQVQFDMDEYIRNMSESQFSAFSKLSVSKRREIETQMQQDAASSLFEFKSDFTFKVSKNGDILEQGQWMIQQDGKTIIAKNSEGFEDKITLLEVSKDRLVMSSEQYGQSVVLVPLKE